ncbi:MAG: hypothetical protein FWD27_01445 [Coriobacteriia bacterium]|nr:hypothetical protein [Coriobacteriia bacterium]
MITKDDFNYLILEEDYSSVLSLFDEDPFSVRRLLTQLTYAPDTQLHANAIKAFVMLSKERAQANPLFFTETIRRHIWGMNEEGGNIDWSAPEIIAAIIAGNMEQFKEFAPIMFYNALPELIFHDSLRAALLLLKAVNPELTAPYLAELDAAI